MSRPSSSRCLSSYSYTDTPSRRSSTASNPNIFSDDYALEPIDPNLELSLEDSIQSDFMFAEPDRTRDTLNITPYPAIPARLSMLGRPNSISKRPNGSDDAAAASSSHDESVQRSLSTSSRFSFVRSQSPYRGPTQPSHPYALYPQITRASSIASESTIRPRESPFVPTGGPEHPYSLYPQNTMPEDDAEDIGEQPIPLGFPRLGLGAQASSRTARSDVGDIIGSDGHVEQLPPYTRYADNIIAKGDMANINRTSTSATNRPVSQRSTIVPVETASDTVRIEESNEREILLTEETKPVTWKEKAQRRVCGGSIALWLLTLIIALVVFAGIVGGVIGGVVGRSQGQNFAVQQAQVQPPQPAVTTIYIDADPAATDSSTPACPTGRYTIPLNQTREINACVGNPPLAKSWDCLDIAFLGITISDSFDPTTGNKSLQVRFDDYSVNTSAFLYGPQPPDFNGSSFNLKPYRDRDNQNLGIAMFFYEEFDKLIILPWWALDPSANNKRSISAREIHQRGQQVAATPLRQGDRPWYCFWNSTINEFFIYLEEGAKPTSTSAAAGPLTTSAGFSTWGPVAGLPTPTHLKRDTYTTPYYPQYPQLVKMVEKRKPQGNVAPYCQKMVVLDDWNVVPDPSNTIITIEELEYASDPLSIGMSRRSQRRDSTTQELESDCVCEWMSI